MKVYGVGEDYDTIIAVFSDEETAERAVHEFKFGDYVEEYEVDKYVHIVDGPKKYEVIMSLDGRVIMRRQDRMSIAERFKNAFVFDVTRYGHRHVVQGIVFAKTEEEAIAATEQYRLKHIRLDSKFA